MGNKEIKRAIHTIIIHAGMYDNSHSLVLPPVYLSVPHHIHGRECISLFGE